MAYEEQTYVDGWLTYSSWIDNIRENKIISSYDRDESFRKTLMSCSSNRERFQLIWSQAQIKDEISKIYATDMKSSMNGEQKPRYAKSHEVSNELRDQGNKSFKEKNYPKALSEYSQAVRCAPYPSQASEERTMALALANRSAALYNLKRYKSCLADIELALKYGYPEESKIKLLTRKVKCFHVLSIWSSDSEETKSLLTEISKKPTTSEAFKREIKNMFEFLDTTDPEKVEKDELDGMEEYFTKLANTSKHVSQGIDCVEMSHTPERGRFLMVNKDIGFGRCAIIESPFVCNLAPIYRDSHCYSCFGRLHNCGLCCRNCTDVLYCSEECMDQMEEIHSLECDGFLKTQETLGVMYIIAHIMFKIEFNPFVLQLHRRKTIEQKPIEEFLQIPYSEWPDYTYKSDYGSVVALMDHAGDYDFDQHMAYSLTATYLMTAFIHKFGHKFPSLLELKNQLLIGSVVLRHIMQLQTNLVSILEQNLRGLTLIGHKLSEVKERPIGVGIYPTVALLNHSCAPNIISIFNRNKFIARATKPCPCGTELLYCYGPSVNSMSKKDRQKRLKEQYFFSCRCEACEKNLENKCRALLCPKCQGPVIYNHDMTSECIECHIENPVDASAILVAASLLKKSVNALEADVDMIGATKLDKLTDLESQLSKLVFWRDPIFVKIKSLLVDCAEQDSNAQLALQYCNDELDLCSRTFGKDSYEVTISTLKVINMKWEQLYHQVTDNPDSDGAKEGILELEKLLLEVNEIKQKLRSMLASTNIAGAESSYETEIKFLNEIGISINNFLRQFKKTENPNTSLN